MSRFTQLRDTVEVLVKITIILIIVSSPLPIFLITLHSTLHNTYKLDADVD